MKSADFLDAVRAKHGLTSDYQVHKFLRIAQSRVSMYRTGRREFDSKTCHLVANALDVDPAWVMVEIQVERANRTEDRDAWQRVADLVKIAGVASVLALAVLLEVDAPALENAGVGVLCILCYIALRALWRTFQPDRHTHPKPRTPIGHPRGAQSFACIATLALLSGCTSSPAEKAWQTMHLVDVAQTINGAARDPCFHERDPFTRRLIGRQPSTESVLLWGVGVGVTHYALDRWLTNSGHANKKWVRILRAVDLGAKGFTIGRNHQIGIRVFGDNHCSGRP